MDSKELRAKLDELGVCFAECIEAFAAPDDDPYVLYAQEHWNSDEISLDDHVVVSRGGDDGAFVLAWVWCSDEDLHANGFIAGAGHAD